VFDATGPFAEANRKIWDHSVAVARLARDLASYVGRRDADAYYLAGLLHDIGKPVVAAMLQAHPEITAVANVAAVGATAVVDIVVGNAERAVRRRGGRRGVRIPACPALRSRRA